MKLFLTVFIIWSACLYACKDQGKTVSEDNLVAEANPADGDYLAALMFPSAATISAGRTVSFEALGLLPYDHSSNISARGKWTIANRKVLTEYEDGTLGRFRALGPGSSDVTFTLGTLSVTGNVTVTNKLLQIVKISEEQIDENIEGIQSSYVARDIGIQAFGIYSDGSTEDLTTDAIWSSDDSSNFSSLGNGGFRLINPTTTRLNAKVNDIQGSIPVSIKSIDRHFTGFTLDPSPLILPLNTDMPYMLRANYSNGESEDISSTATFQMSAPSLASVTQGGSHNIRGLSIGIGSLSVSYMGHEQSYPVRVVEAQALEMVLTSPSKNFHMAKGDKEFFLANLRYSDGTLQNVTSLSTWLSDDITTLAKAGSGADFGYYSAARSGETKLKATFGAFVVEKTVVIDGATIVSISIESNDTGPVGQFYTRSYTAKAIYSDATTRTLTGSSVTWSYIVGSVQTTFTTRGLLDSNATAVQGPLTVKVVSAGVTATLPVTVGPPVPVSIDIVIPPTHDDQYVVWSLAAGPVNLIANVKYSDNTVVDQSALATWDYDIFTTPFSFAGYVRDDVGFKGRLTPVAEGYFGVTAVFQGITGSKTVKVEP